MTPEERAEFEAREAPSAEDLEGLGQEVHPRTAESLKEMRQIASDRLAREAAERQTRDTAEAAAISRSLKKDVEKAGGTEALTEKKRGLTAADVTQAHAEAQTLSRKLDSDKSEEEENAEWAGMKSKVKADTEWDRAHADSREAIRSGKAETADTWKESQQLGEAAFGEYSAHKGIEDSGLEVELTRVNQMYIEEFGQGRHAELQKRFEDLTDQMTALRPWNIFKRRALQKEVEQVMKQMDLKFENYAQLKRDLARAEHDAANGDPKLRAVFQAEVRKLQSELAPFEEIVARQTHEDAALGRESRRDMNMSDEDKAKSDIEANKSARAYRAKR